MQKKEKIVLILIKKRFFKKTAAKIFQTAAKLEPDWIFLWYTAPQHALNRGTMPVKKRLKKTFFTNCVENIE